MSQSIRDAEADAETLRLVTLFHHGRRGYARTNLRRARRVGNDAAMCMRNGEAGWAKNYAWTAAHAAFSAVPGLRG